MQLYGMDPVLIEIQRIKNLEVVKLWDFLSTENAKQIIVPGLFISYDGGKTLNLCAKDKHFRQYTQKVLEVYQDEKNNLLEDSLTDPFGLHSAIDIDLYTQKVLDCGKLQDIDEVYNFYCGKNSFETSFLFQIDEVRPLMDIVRYHLTKFFSFTNHVVSFEKKELMGYRDNYVIFGQIDGIETMIPFSFSKKSNYEYNFAFSSFLEKNQFLSMDISFKKDRLSVDISMDNSDLLSQATYLINDGLMKEIYEIQKNGITLCYRNKDLKKTDSIPLLNLADIDCKTSLSWFALPWDAYYGIRTSLSDLSDFEKMIEIHNVYVSGYESGFMKKEYYSKQYKRNKTATLSAYGLSLDELKKTVNGFLIDSASKSFIVETSFDADDGLYQGSDNGKYYYHAFQKDEGLIGVAKEDLVELTKQNIIRNSDLLNKAKILKLCREALK